MNRTRIVTAAALLSASIGQALAAGPADAPAGALACSGCHPTARFVDTTVTRLVNRNPADIVAAMQGFKSGQIHGTVMGGIAKGFTDDEDKVLAGWFGVKKG